MKTIIIKIEGYEYKAELYNNESADAFFSCLPAKISMTSWGDEYYGSFSNSIPHINEQRDLYKVGEIAYWPPGNAFCIFFGPTPVSTDNQPKMASPGIPLGKIITGDINKLKTLGGQISITITQ